MPDDLQALLNKIPTAGDGDIVTKQYHNSIRDTLAAIVTQLGIRPTSQTVTVGIAPMFLRSDPQVDTWNQLFGSVSNPASSSALVDGWLPIQLPSGVNIQSMTVSGQRKGTVQVFQVQLVRQRISDASLKALIPMSLENEANPFQKTAFVQASGSDLANLDDYKLVNNTTYKYLITARLAGLTALPADVVRIDGLQVVYTSS